MASPFSDFLALDQADPQVEQEAPAEPLEVPALDRDSINSFISGNEGRRVRVYDDTEGVPTVGTGFNLNRADAREKIEGLGVNYDDLLSGRTSLTDNQADLLFETDLDTAISDARALFSNFDTLAPARQAVLVDMALNMGINSLGKFENMIAAIETEDFEQAAAEAQDSTWFTQVGDRGPRNVAGLRTGQLEGYPSDTISVSQAISEAPQNEVEQFLQSDPDPSLPLAQAVGTNADENAEHQRLSQASGIPVEAVAKAPEPVRNQVRTNTLENLLSSSPVTGRFLANPENAQVAHDDVENLSAIEQLSRAFKRGGLIREQGILGSRLRDTRSPEVQAKLDIVRDQIKALGEDGDGFIGWISSAAEVLGQQVASLGSPEAAIRVGGGGVTGAATGATLGLVGGPVAPATSAAGAAAGSLVGMGAGLISHLTIDAFEVEGGNAYVEMLDQGIEEPIARSLSLGVGIINSGLEMAGATVVLKPMAAGGRKIIQKGIKEAVKRTTVKQAAAQMAKVYGAGVGAEVTTEVMQEAVQIAAEEWGKVLSEEDLDAASADEITDRIETIAIKTFKAMTVLALPGPGANFAIDASAARQAKTRREDIQELHKVQDQSKLQERDPDKAAEHQAAALKEAGVEEVFIVAEAIQELAAKSDLSPTEFYQQMGIEDQMEEALVIGGDVRLTGQQFARHVMQSDNFEQLADHIRFRSEDMTAAEAKEFEKSGVQDEIERLGLETGEQLEEEAETVTDKVTDFVTEHRDAGKTFGEVFQAANRLGDDTFTRSVRAEIERRTQPEAKEPTEAQRQNDPVSLAEDQLGLQGIFRTAEEAGMTQKQYEGYLVAVESASQASRKRFEARLLKQQQRENSAEFKRELEQRTEQHRETVRQEPVYAALEAIDRDRLDRDAIAAILPEGTTLADLPKQTGNRAIFTNKGEQGGIHPDELAQLYDFDDGAQMLLDIITAPPFETVVTERALADLRKERGDIFEEAASLEAAIEELHADNYAAVLAAEVNQLRDAKKQGRLKAALVRRVAQERIRDFAVKDITPAKFFAAERRQAKLAGKLLRKGDRAGAAQAKFRQLINFQMAQEAIRVREQVAKKRKFLRKFLKPRKKKARLPLDYFNTIQTILSDYELETRLSPKKRQQLEEFALTKASEDGTAVEIPQRILNEAKTKNFQDLSLAEFEELHDTIKTLNHQGLEDGNMRFTEEKRERQEIADGVAEQVRENLKPQGRIIETRSTLEKNKQFGREAMTLLFNADTILREIDGFTDLGPAFQAVKGGIDRAISDGYQPGQIGYLRRQKKEATALLDLFKVFSKKERLSMSKKLNIPGVGVPLSRGGMLSVLLNSGNAENISALTESEQFSENEITAIHEFASKKDWEFAQSVWDYFDSFWSEIKEATERRTGITPERVIPQAIETEHGTFRGGYYPLRYDNKQSILGGTAAGNVENIITDMRLGKFASSHTRRSHTENRVGSGGKKVLLDLFVINSHVEQVIYDLEVGDAITDSYRILHHRTVKQAFEEQGQVEKWDALDLWLGDAITGEMRLGGMMEHSLRWLRTGFTVSKLAWNVGTMLLQSFGVIQTSVVIGKKNTLVGLRTVFSSPQFGENSIYKFIAAQTGFMEAREETFNKDIIDASRTLSESFVAKVTPGKSAELVTNTFFYGIKKFQRFVDAVTWIGAKHDGMQKFDGDEKLSNQHADRMVARSQASGLFAERTPLERGTVSKKVRQTEFIRIWTPLISYFMAKTNVAYERTKRTNFRNPGQVAGWATDMALLYLGEALLVSLMRGQWPDEDADDEEVLLHVGREGLSSVMAGVPLAREFISEAQGFRGGGVIGSAVDAFGKVSDQVAQGEIDTALVKNMNNLFGMLFHYPSSQLNKTGEAISLHLDGEDLDLIEFLMGPKFDR